MAPTTHLSLSHMGSDICGVIDSFRNPVVFRAPIETHGRVALYKAQRRWAALFKKREVTMRFDIELPQYPGLVGVIALYQSLFVDTEFFLRPVCGHINDSNQWVHHAQAGVLFHWFRIHYST